MHLDLNSPKQNDIIFAGIIPNQEISCRFRGVEDLKEYDEFRAAAVKKYSSFNELFNHADALYEKPSGWFHKNFVNNAICGALDSLSLFLNKEVFLVAHHEGRQIDIIVGNTVIWCVFLNQRYGNKEVPEVFSTLEIIDEDGKLRTATDEELEAFEDQLKAALANTKNHEVEAIFLKWKMTGLLDGLEPADAAEAWLLASSFDAALRYSKEKKLTEVETYFLFPLIRRIADADHSIKTIDNELILSLLSSVLEQHKGETSIENSLEVAKEVTRLYLLQVRNAP